MEKKEFKHTSAPWRVREEHGFLFVESPKEVCGKSYGQEILGEDYFDEFDKKADARLVSVSPELLDICIDFVEKVERGEAKSVRTYNRMKEVIAKVLGE